MSTSLEAERKDLYETICPRQIIGKRLGNSESKWLHTSSTLEKLPKNCSIGQRGYAGRLLTKPS